MYRNDGKGVKYAYLMLLMGALKGNCASVHQLVFPSWVPWKDVLWSKEPDIAANLKSVWKGWALFNDNSRIWVNIKDNDGQVYRGLSKTSFWSKFEWVVNNLVILEVNEVV